LRGQFLMNLLKSASVLEGVLHVNNVTLQLTSENDDLSLDANHVLVFDGEFRHGNIEIGGFRDGIVEEIEITRIPM
jgi:hypothetical protein